MTFVGKARVTNRCTYWYETVCSGALHVDLPGCVVFSGTGNRRNHQQYVFPTNDSNTRERLNSVDAIADFVKKIMAHEVMSSSCRFTLSVSITYVADNMRPLPPTVMFLLRINLLKCAPATVYAVPSTCFMRHYFVIWRAGCRKGGRGVDNRNLPSPGFVTDWCAWCWSIVVFQTGASGYSITRRWG